jgi:hypothetical protein
VKRLAFAVLLLFLGTAPGWAVTCAGVAGSVLGGFCVPYQILVDPQTGAALGSSANPLVVQTAPIAAANGGLSVYRVNSPSGAPGLVVKAGPGRLYAFDLCNTAAASRYVHFYDTTSPVPGTTPVYAGAITISAGSCQQFNTSFGLSFSNGIGMGITGANGDSDTTSVTAGDVTGFLGFL